MTSEQGLLEMRARLERASERLERARLGLVRRQAALMRRTRQREFRAAEELSACRTA
jgi:hypothetical protein